MTAVIIILAFIGLVITAAYLHRRGRQNKYSKWKVGDMLVINIHLDELKSHNMKYAELRGWDDHFVYAFTGRYVHVVKYVNVDNKSAFWRNNYENCKQVMGKEEPTFIYKIPQAESDRNEGGGVHGVINGIEIAAMNETECEVYLKVALKEQKYESAELIKQRMVKFR